MRCTTSGRSGMTADQPHTATVRHIVAPGQWTCRITPEPPRSENWRRSSPLQPAGPFNPRIEDDTSADPQEDRPCPSRSSRPVPPSAPRSAVSIWPALWTTPRSPRSSRPMTRMASSSFAASESRQPQQVAFTRRFGEIEFNIFGERWSVPGSPEIVVVSNITEDGRPVGVRRAGENWHSDMCYAARPPRGTMLYALEIPDLFGLTLGDTEFASAAAAWMPCLRRCAGRSTGAARCSTSPAASGRFHRPRRKSIAIRRSAIRSFGPIPAPGASASTSCATIAPGSRASDRKRPRR